MASEQARLYHSVEFGDKNTWDDWYLVPTNRPIVNPPTQKTQIIDIPGADGLLDISESLTGYPIYNNREGSIEFYVMNDYPEYRWTKVYSDILQHIHGKELNMVLDDEPEYFYHGRFAVSGWQTEKERSKVTIAYSVGPYKWARSTSIDDWEWDPFNFEDDYIEPAVWKDIEVDSDTSYVYKNFTPELSGMAPFCPQFIVQSTDGRGLESVVVNSETGETKAYKMPDGTFYAHTIMVHSGVISLGVRGHGKVSIVFRKGKL